MKCIICLKDIIEDDGIICIECFKKIMEEAKPMEEEKEKSMETLDKPSKEKELKDYIKVAKEEKAIIRIYMIHHFYGPMRGMFIDVKPDIILVKSILKNSFEDLMKKFWDKTGLSCHLMIHSKINNECTVMNNIKEVEAMLIDKIDKAPSVSEKTWYFRKGKLK